MPQNDGEVVFDVRGNLDKLPKDLNDAKTAAKKAAEKMESEISNGMENAAKDAKSSADKISDAMQDIEADAKGAGKSIDQIDSGGLDDVSDGAESAGGALQDVAESAGEAADGIEKVADNSDSASDKMGKLSSVASGIGSGLKVAAGAGAAAAAAIGGAAIAAGSFAVGSAVSLDKALNSLEASTGASTAKMGQYEEVLKKIYANNYGEDFDDISSGIADVTKNLGGMTGASLQDVTESAFAMRDAFEYEIPESTRAAKAMVDNFGISGKDAMSLIAAGAQNGLDYSGELIDSINEYSVQFAKIGFSADDMFKIFQQGADSGAWNLDKVGDAIKEFSIRAIDGSKATAEGFTSIGLNADKMSAKFGKGGDAAKDAFNETIVALDKIKDPLKKDAAGVALFGTMWEDLGADAVAALAGIKGGSYDASNAMGQIKKVKYDDLGSMFEGLKRSVELLALPLGEELIPLLTDLIQDAMPMIEEHLPDIIDLFSEFVTPILELAEDALPELSGVLSSIMDGVMPTMTKDVLPDLKEAFGSIQEPLMMLVTEALPPLMSLFSSIMPIIADLAAMLLPPLIDVFMALLPPITDLIQSLLPVLMDLFSQIAPIISDLAPIISVLADLFGKTLSSAISTIMPIVSHVISTFSDLIGFISDVFTGNWEGAWNHIVSFFKTCLNTLPMAAEAVINGLVDMVNGLIRGVNKVTGVIGISAIGEWDHVSLPRFHTGGIVDFDGKYEDTILAKDGEMVLTEDQQRRLFDIANGAAYDYPASSPAGQSVVSYYTTETTEITNHNEFTVRDDSDIRAISEGLASLEDQEYAGKGN